MEDTNIDELTPEERRIHEKYMDKAIAQAKRAYANGDVPIGCVIVHDDRIIARGFNKRNLKKTTLAHAEILFFCCNPKEERHFFPSGKARRLAAGGVHNVCDP